MNIGIVGGRLFKDDKLFTQQVDSFISLQSTSSPICIITGGAEGADTLAANYAREKGISLTIYKPDWIRHGKAAGMIRNKDIIEGSDRVIAFWDKKSKGTENSIQLAKTKFNQLKHPEYLRIVYYLPPDPVIEFYAITDKPYGSFSNYSLYAITIDNIRYPSVEHFYQSQKFDDIEYQSVIRNARTPHQSKVLASQKIRNFYKWTDGRDLNEVIKSRLLRGIRVKDNWDQIKESIMTQGLKAKFEQHPELATLLINTGNKVIIEDSPTDWYWGCGNDKKGKNRLGHLLMNIRSELMMALEDGEQPVTKKIKSF